MAEEAVIAEGFGEEGEEEVEEEGAEEAELENVSMW